MRFDDDLILVDLDTLMRITGYGRRRAQKIAELAKARVYIGKSVRYSVDKLREYAVKAAI